MAPKYKIDSTKRVIAGIMGSDVFNKEEKFAHLLGMRSMARIMAGPDAGVTRYLEAAIDKGV